MSTSSIALLSVQFGEEMESRRSINLTNNSAECTCSVTISELYYALLKSFVTGMLFCF